MRPINRSGQIQVIFRQYSQSDFVMESIWVSERGGDVKDGPQFSDLFYFFLLYSLRVASVVEKDVLCSHGDVKMLTLHL